MIRIQKKRTIFALVVILVILLFPILLQSVGTPTASIANANSDTIRKVEFTHLWSFESKSSVVTKPVVANGLVYVTSGGSFGGIATLYCLNASSGTQIWNSSGLFYPYSVANGFVYAGGSFWDASTSWTLQGVFSCLKASEGTQVWNYSYGTSFATPVVDGGIVYAPGFNYTISTGINIGFIYAFNALTGEKTWNFIGPIDTRFDSDSLLLIDGNLYALSAAYSERDASWQSYIYALNAHTGDRLWSYTMAGQFSALAVADQTVYVSSNFVNTTEYTDAQYSGGYIYDGGLLALNASNGKKLWEYPIKGSVETPILGNEMVYAVSGNGKVFALNVLDGTEIWKRTIEPNLGHGLLVKDFLYLGSPEGAYCFNALNGALVWDFRAKDYVDSSATFPVYTDGIIYVGWNGPQFFASATSHDFYAIDALTGEKIGNYTLEYTLQNSPLVTNNTLYLGASSVTEESPDWPGHGAVVVLKPTVVEGPSPSKPPSPLEVSLAIIIIIAAIAGLIVYFKKRKG